ncbi:MAG: bacillithiol biosynthesis deacetylase BshB1 [candidate division Zixibacteria bacterium]|nr:bacillithiol biosynthesis deacetylase BshB1 [candidate division Zixibacteria bacterium]
MADRIHLDVLAIAAHPDDVEITCGGLMIKMASLGRTTGVLDLTEGEMSTLGTTESRQTEAAAAAEILGLSWRANLGLPDAAVESTSANKLKLAQVIRDTRPEMVVLPHWEQRHPDHLACCRLGYDACYLAGLKKADLSGEAFRPRKIIYASYFRNSDYSFLVDISDEMDKKCEAVAAYKSQFGGAVTAKQIFQPGVDIFDLMRTRAGALGQVVDVKYAEAYTVKEKILLDDPFLMPVQSI